VLKGILVAIVDASLLRKAMHYCSGVDSSLYRSQHELLPLFKKGTTPHVNNVELGKRGRWSSNVWTYPGASSLGSDARRGLKDHPTVKPTAMLEDALLDLSNRGEIVIDPFLGPARPSSPPTTPGVSAAASSWIRSTSTWSFDAMKRRRATTPFSLRAVSRSRRWQPAGRWSRRPSRPVSKYSGHCRFRL
jgi:hypothetical protein